VSTFHTLVSLHTVQLVQDCTKSTTLAEVAILVAFGLGLEPSILAIRG